MKVEKETKEKRFFSDAKKIKLKIVLADLSRR